MNNMILTGKANDKGQALAITHYAKGVWKVLGLNADGTCAWFIPTTSKTQALRLVDWHGTKEAR